jgi:hypothetical protein
VIAMSNLEEFAQAVGRDVKRFETDYTTKAELEAKDFIEGKSEYQILKHQVESLVKQNQVLQEQLNLVRPVIRKAPMAYRLDRSGVPWTIWFDNGCGLQINSHPTDGDIYGYGRDVNCSSTRWEYLTLVQNIISCSRGTLTLEYLKSNIINADLWSFDVTTLDPIENKDDYDWSNARFHEQKNLQSWEWANHSNVIKIMYELGIWDAKTVESLGAVRS